MSLAGDRDDRFEDGKGFKRIVASKAMAKRKEGPREQVDRGVVRARQRQRQTCSRNRFNSVIQHNNPYILLFFSSIPFNAPNTAFSASNNTPEASGTSTDKNICFPYRRAVHTSRQQPGISPK